MREYFGALVRGVLRQSGHRTVKSVRDAGKFFPQSLQVLARMVPPWLVVVPDARELRKGARRRPLPVRVSMPREQLRNRRIGARGRPYRHTSSEG